MKRFASVMVACFVLLVSVQLNAAPQVSNDNGLWFDNYIDSAGVSAVNNVQHNAPTRAMQLVPGQTSGSYTTVLIRPTSFDAWETLTLDATIGNSADLTLDILSAANTPLITNLPLVGGVGDLSSLDPVATADGIRVRVNLAQTGSVSPSVNSLSVRWNPISLLLLDNQAPTSVLVGQVINYTLRYSVNFVQAENLVLWDELPSGVAVSYPTDYGQDDTPTFVSATDGGLYCNTGGGCTVSGVTVPQNSVYWDLGTVPAGTTVAVSFAVRSPNGALDGTEYDNVANINASNATAITSNSVTTILLSDPAPNIQKRVSRGGVPLPSGNTYVFRGQRVQFTVSDPLGGLDGNDYAPEGRERMYNTVLWDDVSDLVANIDTALGDNGFLNITGGGQYVANYSPPDGSATLAHAIVWDSIGAGADSIFAPGVTFLETFEVEILDPPAQDTFVNIVCLDSDQTDTICDQVVLETIPDERVTGIFSKGDDLNNAITAKARQDDDKTLATTYGGTYKYLLHINNTSLVTVTDVVMVDMIPTEVDLIAAYVPAASANATVFYTTTTTFTDPDTPPPFITTTLPAELGGWISWEANPPADPAQVTWVAFHLPEVSPAYIGDGQHRYYAHFDVEVKQPVDSCVGARVDNVGHFYAFGRQPFGGGTPVPLDLYATDPELTIVAADTATLNIDQSNITLSPDPVQQLSNIVNYSVEVENLIQNGVAHGVANARIELQWSQVEVFGALQYLDFVTASGGTIETFDPTNGRIVINVGTLAAGASETVDLQLSVPAGVLDDTRYSIDATLTGEPTSGSLCTPSSASASKTGTIISTGQIQVFKEDVLDVIPGGGDLEYRLTFNNIGDGPTTGTFVVDRIPDRMVFDYATGPNGEQVYVTDKTFPDLPLELSVVDRFDSAEIATHFTPATYDAGTQRWTSPFGEQTTWIAWLVDDQSVSPPQFPINDTRNVSFFVRNDEDRGAAQVDSNAGVLIFNEAAIFSNELLQAIGNEVRTTIEETPGLYLAKTGSDVIVAGADFEWYIDYYNNSGSADDVVVIEDVLPAGVSFVSATHTWNAAATANGASGIATGSVPSQTINNPDGTTTLIFRIADDYRGGDLATLEGGRITITARADSAPNGTFLTNNVCGTATNVNGTVYVCSDHTVEVQNPDLWIIKSADNPQPNVGDTVTYLIRLSNEGGFSAENTLISDVLAPGMSYVSNSVQMLTSGYTIGEPVGSGTLVWSAANGNAIQQTGQPAGLLPANSGSIFFTYQAIVNSGNPGDTLTNTITTSTDTPEVDVHPNSDDASVRLPFPDPTVFKTVPAFTEAGAFVNWTITYLNKNNADAMGVYLIDTLPDWDNDDVVDVSFIRNSLPAGVTAYYHDNAPSNVPTFEIGNPTNNGWTADPSGIDVVHIAYAVGDLLRNAGPFNIAITTQLVNPIDATTPPAGAALTNDVTIDSETVDDDVTNNSADATTRVPGLDLALTKSGSIEGGFPGTAPGETLIYTIEFANTGPETAYGVKITETLPAGVTFDSHSFEVVELIDSNGNGISPVDHDSGNAAYSDPVPVTFDQGTMTWYLGNNSDVSDPLFYRRVGLPPGAEGSFQLIVTINSDVADGTTLENNAAIITDRYQDGDPAEEFLGNNYDDSSVSVYRTDLFVNKSVVDAETGDDFWTEAGNILTYTIEYGNIGNIDAEDVVISEIIPDGTSYVPSSLQVPEGSLVSFSPSESNPTRFDVRFQSPLPAPSTFFNQSTATDWQQGRLTNIVPPTRYSSSRNFNDDGAQITNAVVAADFNNDGLPDLVVGNATGILVYLNLDGTRPVLIDQITKSQATDVIAFDADNDGDLDLAVANSDEEGQVLLNDGSGNFSFQSSFAPSDEWYGVAALDADSDGDQDLLFANHGQNQLVFNDGAGNFSTTVEGTDFINIASSVTLPSGDTWAVESFDADGDGDLDVAVAGSGQNALYINNGDGTITVVDTFGDAASRSIVALDVDRDGDLDVAVGNGDSNSEEFNHLWINDGSGNFTLGSEEIFGGETFTYAIEAFDADGDGDADVLTGDGLTNGYLNELFLNDGQGAFVKSAEFNDFGNRGTRSIATADFNNDGVLDIVLGYAGNNELYLSNNGNICLAIEDQQFDAGSSDNTFANNSDESFLGMQADMDGNGHTDPILSDQRNIGQYLNDGAGGYTYSNIVTLSSSNLNAMTTLDIDADGDLDLVAALSSSEANRVYRNNGDGTYTQIADPGDVATHLVNTIRAVSADFDNDGDDDLILINTPDFDVQAFINNGDGQLTFADGVDGTGTFPTNFTGAYHAAAIDAEGDGDLDILIGGNALGSTTSELHINDGAGNFTRTTPFTGHTYLSAERPEVADYDADGDSDVFIVRNDTVYLYGNNGSGGFSLISTTAFTTCRGGDYLDSITPLDLNGDGFTDLVSGGESCSVLMHYGNGNGVFGDPVIYNTHSFEQTFLPTDYNGDGTNDLLAVGGDGVPAIYLYDGYQTPANVISPLITPTDLYPSAGELSSWGYLIVEQTLPDETAITYDILDQSLSPIAGFTGVSADASSRINLSTLDVATYPTIALRANFQTSDLYQTPELCSWTTTFRMSEGAKFTFRVRVDDPATANPINNNVAIQTTTPETNYDNNNDSDRINVRMTDLYIEKQVNTATALVGDTLTYTLRYGNNGPQDAINGVVQDVLPLGVTFVSADPAPTSTSGTGGANDPVILTWNIGDLAVGATGELSVVATINAGQEDETLLNLATISNDRQETDLTNNDDDAVTYVGSLTNVYLLKDGPATTGLGQTITYTLSYGNNGTASAENVSVSDVLPTGVTFVSATPAISSQNGQTLTWGRLGTLASGEMDVITLTVAITTNADFVGQQLHNVATVSTTSDEVTQQDNSDDHTNTVLISKATLSGYVWHDVDEDVVFEDDEAGLPGVTIRLQGNDIFGEPVNVMTETDEDGFYIFTGLNPGDYALTETQPVTYTSTGAVLGSNGGVVDGTDAFNTIRIASGDQAARYDFGEDFGVSVGDRIWHDDNRNGQQDDGELGISNVLLYLYRDTDRDNAFTPSVDEYLDLVFSGATGDYRFDGLMDGDYVVQVAQSNFDDGGVLAGWQNTVGSADPDDDPSNTDDNGAPLSGHGVVSTAISLTVGTEPIDDGDTDNDTNLTVDFGFYQTVEIGNYVWIEDDSDGNALTGATTPVTNTTVTATSADGTIYTGVTDANGIYTITVSANATYTVTVGTPVGYVPSGTLISSDNDPATNDNMSHDPSGTVVTVTDVDHPTIDFGFTLSPNTPSAELGDRVWFDDNANGVQDDGESGIEGIAIALLDEKGSNVLNEKGQPITATTTITGFYQFTDLSTGSYIVRLERSNWEDGGVFGTGGTYEGAISSVGQGADDGTATDDNGDDDISDGIESVPITLDASEREPTVDFGVFQPLAIGNLIWDDSGAAGNANNGIFDGDESGINGVTVQLYRDTGDNVFNLNDDTLITTTVTVNGYYLFDMLPEGEYYIHIPATNFQSDGSLWDQGNDVPYFSAQDRDGGGDNGSDHTADENGIDTTQPQSEGVTSNRVSLGRLDEPTTEVDATPAGRVNGNVNLTVDFAFFAPGATMVGLGSAETSTSTETVWLALSLVMLLTTWVMLRRSIKSD